MAVPKANKLKEQGWRRSFHAVADSIQS